MDVTAFFIFTVVTWFVFWFITNTYSEYQLGIITELIKTNNQELNKKLKSVELSDRHLLQERIKALSNLHNSMLQGFFEKRSGIPSNVFFNIIDLYIVWTNHTDIKVAVMQEEILINVEGEVTHLNDFLFNNFYKAMMRELYDAETDRYEGTIESFVEHCKSILKNTEYDF